MSAPLAALALLAVLAGPPIADDAPARGRDRSKPAEQQRKPPPREASGAKEKLSEEDAALIRDLALLERVELLQHLELFEAQQKDAKTAVQR